MKSMSLGGFTVAFCVLLAASTASPAGDDLTVTKKITVGATNITAQALVKGARTRTTMDMGGGAAMVTIRQCDLKRSLTLNDPMKTYVVKPDMEENDSSKAAAAALLGAGTAPEAGGTVTYTSTAMDTGERKQAFGYQARHMKITILAESSPKSCSVVKQKYEIDGWYIDLEDQASCQVFSPYLKDVQGCHDHVVLKQSGTAKPGFAIQEVVRLTNGDDAPMVITTEVTDLKKAPLAPELFDVPADYRQASAAAELFGAPQSTAQLNGVGQDRQSPEGQRPPTPTIAQMMNPASAAATQMSVQRQAWAQAAQLGLAPGGMPAGMGAPAGGTPVAAPQALGPKAPEKIRIGVVAPQAQVGQGSGAGADYGTPIRNAMIQLMSGPSVDIAPLDAHIPLQVQAEAQQKQCDYILYSSVVVKHVTGSHFGKFVKMAAPLASIAPLAGGMGGAAAGAAAAQAASAAAQQAAMSQMAVFTGQIKSKDEVTYEFQFYPAGQDKPKVRNSLQAKAKGDGEDVLTPLLTQAATTVLTEATKQ